MKTLNPDIQTCLLAAVCVCAWGGGGGVGGGGKALNPDIKTYLLYVGTDEYGELVHSTMYPQLVTNVPKECMEYPDYSFQQHFGKSLPSYVDATTLRDYLEGMVPPISLILRSLRII